ncbi:MAG: hypothetical protein KZQ90_08650 [Candidatus Thiodiazotropha sp. (ex Codakia rugifera)]|nr:hypothetical protein [Candidatus Thiodiazotropha sp. (ex Codakia rugifera)]
MAVTATVVLAMTIGSVQAADFKPKDSHQWLGGKKEVHDESVAVITRREGVAGSDVEVKLYFGKSLLNPRSNGVQ